VPRWTLASGSHLLLEGPSGCGKTTFLHLLAGLLPPQKGQIKIGDFLLSQKTDAERGRFRRQNIGLVFQKLNLLDHLSIEENILLGAKPHHAQVGQNKSILSRLGLEGKGPQLCASLSQGEQQRVAVARVLAARPDLILADEPTSSLDEKNARFVIEALQEAAQGKTLIVVSHDQRIRPLFKQVVNFADVIR